MKVLMSITVISDHREAKLSKQTDLPFLPHAGMDFFHRTKTTTVKNVLYIEPTNSFIVTFEDIEIEVSRYDEMIDILMREHNYTMQEQWKKK